MHRANITNLLSLGGGNIRGIINYYNTMFMNTGLYMNSDQMIYNISTNPTHLFQHGGIQIALINNNGLYIVGNPLSSTVLGYLKTASSDILSPLKKKICVTGGNLTLSTGSLILGTCDLTSTILHIWLISQVMWEFN